MKRKLLDHERHSLEVKEILEEIDVINVIDEIEENKFRFYLEHATIKKNTYCLHFNFSTEKAAEEIFIYMRDEWKLPVELFQNRIVLLARKPSQESGVVSSVFNRLYFFRHAETLNIIFDNIDHVAGFCKFVTGFNSNGLLAHCLSNCGRPEAHLKKDQLIIPSYSHEKRITVNNRLTHLLWTYKAWRFGELGRLPTELLIIISMLVDDIKDEYSYYQPLNEEFSLTKQQVSIAPLKKITCDIFCEFDLAGFYNPIMYLTCRNADEAQALFDNLQFYTSLNIDLNEKEIAISPCSKGNTDAFIATVYGTYFNRENCYVNLYFKNKNEAEMFLQLVKFDNLCIAPAMINDQLRFESNLLPIYENPYDPALDSEPVFSYSGGM
jgi:hypothetical protein